MVGATCLVYTLVFTVVPLTELLRPPPDTSSATCWSSGLSPPCSAPFGLLV